MPVTLTLTPVTPDLLTLGEIMSLNSGSSSRYGEGIYGAGLYGVGATGLLLPSLDLDAVTLSTLSLSAV